MNISLPRFSNPFAASFHNPAFGIKVEGTGALKLGRIMAMVVGAKSETVEAIDKALADGPKKKTVVTTGPIFKHKEEVKKDDNKSDKTDAKADATGDKAEDGENKEPEFREFTFHYADIVKCAMQVGQQTGRKMAESIITKRTGQAPEQQVAETVTPAPTQDLGQEVVSQAKVVEGSAGGAATTTNAQGEPGVTEGTSVKVLNGDELVAAANKLASTIGTSSGGR